MSNALISLYDITKRAGSDPAIGLLEETTTFAPELLTIMGRPISGTVYKSTSRTLPTVSFRAANNGSDTLKSKYTQNLSECFIIDAQIQADKAVVDAEAKNGVNESVGDILFDESQGILAATGITIGAQFYYGTGADANGFNGVQSLVPNLNSNTGAGAAAACISAGGSTANSETSAYLIWEHIKGVHFVWGNNMGLNMGEFRIQQILGNNSKPLTGYVNNLQGWIGLAANHSKSVARIANIDATHPLTDALGAKLLSLIPLQIQAMGGLKWCINQQALYTLQNSRSAVTTTNSSNQPLIYAPEPTSLCGLPIMKTNSITNIEAVVS